MIEYIEGIMKEQSEEAHVLEGVWREVLQFRILMEILRKLSCCKGKKNRLYYCHQDVNKLPMCMLWLNINTYAHILKRLRISLTYILFLIEFVLLFQPSEWLMPEMLEQPQGHQCDCWSCTIAALQTHSLQLFKLFSHIKCSWLHGNDRKKFYKKLDEKK